MQIGFFPLTIQQMSFITTNLPLIQMLEAPLSSQAPTGILAEKPQVDFIT